MICSQAYYSAFKERLKWIVRTGCGDKVIVFCFSCLFLCEFVFAYVS